MQLVWPSSPSGDFDAPPYGIENTFKYLCLSSLWNKFTWTNEAVLHAYRHGVRSISKMPYYQSKHGRIKWQMWKWFVFICNSLICNTCSFLWWPVYKELTVNWYKYTTRSWFNITNPFLKKVIVKKVRLSMLKEDVKFTVEKKGKASSW